MASGGSQYGPPVRDNKSLNNIQVDTAGSRACSSRTARETESSREDTMNSQTVSLVTPLKKRPDLQPTG